MGCTSDTMCADLVFAIPNVDVAICNALNKKLNITGIPTDTTGSGGFSRFIGNFSTTTTIIGNEDAGLTGKTAACYEDNDDNEYIFFKVLLER